MQKAVITILGTIGGNTKDCKKNENISKTSYTSTIDDISDTKEVNTLPILIKTYSSEFKIISIHTKCAKKIQQEIIDNHSDEIVSSYEIKSEWEIDDKSNYDVIFSKIDEIISSHKKVIIDVSHGYRHLPILMIVNAIMHNIEDIDKIDKIIFAKEIKKNEEYELIDLKKYLDIANISYALTVFSKNYTVASNIKVSDEKLADLLKDLSEFSEHILANSIDVLLKNTNKKKSITTLLIEKIDNLIKKDDGIYKSLNRLLNKNLLHLQKINMYSDFVHYKKIYYISKNMLEKGYLLNSITLLSEALGMYCSLGLKNTHEDVATYIDEFEETANNEKNNKKNVFKLYELYNQSKVFYNIKHFNGTFMQVRENQNKRTKIWNENVKNLTNIIKKNITQDEKLKSLIQETDKIRNNLAHANSSQRVEDVKNDIKTYLEHFNELCIEKNVLNVID